MPTYDYRCADCGVFSAMRSIADRDADSACPECGARARRTISMPSLALMPGTARNAHQINERSANAPRRSGEYRHVHGPACGCGSARAGTAGSAGGAGAAGSGAGGSTNGGSGTSAGRLKGNAQGRPWMISH